MASPDPDGNTRLEISLQSLRIVKAIAETGSITGASRLLGYSQPAISQHLQRAEAKLGIPLITRAGRSVRLTEAGLILSRHALPVMQSLDDASEEIRGLASLRAGKVRLAGFPSASSTIVPVLLSAIKRRRPGIAISYEEAEPPECIAMLKNGECDLAFIFTYPGDGEADRTDYSGISIAPLFNDQMFLVLPRDHPLADEPVVDMVDLQDDQWIAGCPKCRGNLLSFCHRLGFAPDIAYATDNSLAVIGMVASGLGVALVPRLALGTAALPRSVVVRRTNPANARNIHVITGTDGIKSPALGATVAAIGGLDGSPWKLTKVG